MPVHEHHQGAVARNVIADAPFGAGEVSWCSVVPLK